jgi:hypothetical protein
MIAGAPRHPDLPTVLSATATIIRGYDEQWRKPLAPDRSSSRAIAGTGCADNKGQHSIARRCRRAGRTGVRWIHVAADQGGSRLVLHGRQLRDELAADVLIA